MATTKKAKGKTTKVKKVTKAKNPATVSVKKQQKPQRTQKPQKAPPSQKKQASKEEFNPMQDLLMEEESTPVVSNAPKAAALTGRTKTGIQGFDRLIGGGFPAGFTVLLIGTPGTGKSLFALEFLHNGVAKFKEKSMYVTLEQSLDDIRHQAKGIGLDLTKLEKSGDLTLMHVPVSSVNVETVEAIKKEAKKRKVKRLVIDSLSTLAVNAPIYSPIKDIALRDIMNYKAFFSPPVLGDFVVKRFIYTFLDSLKELGCTTLVTTEAPEKGEFLSRDSVSEFAADGIVMLNFESMGGDFNRSLLVRKMRATKADVDMHPFEITEKGIVIHDLQ